jgi:hypothetical protein
MQSSPSHPKAGYWLVVAAAAWRVFLVVSWHPGWDHTAGQAGGQTAVRLDAMVVLRGGSHSAGSDPAPAAGAMPIDTLSVLRHDRGLLWSRMLWTSCLVLCTRVSTLKLLDSWQEHS